VKFVRRDYVSPVLYVQFPKAVDVSHAWVFTAATQGDALFNWDKQGTVQCEPSPQMAYTIALQGGQTVPSAHKRYAFYKLDPQDEDHLSAPPTASALVLRAQQSQPLERGACAEPFRDAMVKDQAQPAYPTVMRDRDTGERSTSVMVAIGSDGTLADAWVWGPSGYEAFDDEALRAARLSKYTGPAAYCKPVPGYYFFRVTFDPGG
jgi:TonB family protein